MHFGEHITIDGYGGSPDLLDDQALVMRALQQLLEMLDMHALAPPQVFFAASNDHKDPGGWSGYIIIQESHISIHTFPKRKFVSADVYTCKNGLDQDLIECFFIETFKLEKVEKHFIKRGTQYPEHNLA
jgi:S-adenosylmethionine decarboxylase